MGRLYYDKGDQTNPLSAAENRFSGSIWAGSITTYRLSFSPLKLKSFMFLRLYMGRLYYDQQKIFYQRYRKTVSPALYGPALLRLFGHGYRYMNVILVSPALYGPALLRRDCLDTRHIRAIRLKFLRLYMGRLYYDGKPFSSTNTIANDNGVSPALYGPALLRH